MATCIDWGSDQCTGGTASASSYYEAGFEPDQAFDDDMWDTSWVSNNAEDELPWIQYYKATGITTGKCRAYGVEHDGYESKLKAW